MRRLLSPETILKLKARAQDPEKRADMAALGTSAVNATEMFAAQRASLARRSSTSK